MTSWGNLYGGIDPYSLSDWYRYLNCGYMVAAVGGHRQDVRLHGRRARCAPMPSIDPVQPFTYEAWKDAIRRGETFVTYGPLLEFAVEGSRLGSRIQMDAARRHRGCRPGKWPASPCRCPRGADRQRRDPREPGRQPREAAGHWSVKVERSSWLALLVRGHYADKPEIIAAHSSPVMVRVEGSPFFAAADAVTILEQIEGALAYLDTRRHARRGSWSTSACAWCSSRRTAPCTTACTSRATTTTIRRSRTIRSTTSLQERGNG